MFAVTSLSCDCNRSQCFTVCGCQRCSRKLRMVDKRRWSGSNVWIRGFWAVACTRAHASFVLGRSSTVTLAGNFKSSANSSCWFNLRSARHIGVLIRIVLPRTLMVVNPLQHKEIGNSTSFNFQEVNQKFERYKQRKEGLPNQSALM